MSLPTRSRMLRWLGFLGILAVVLASGWVSWGAPRSVYEGKQLVSAPQWTIPTNPDTSSVTPSLQPAEGAPSVQPLVTERKTPVSFVKPKVSLLTQPAPTPPGLAGPLSLLSLETKGETPAAEAALKPVLWVIPILDPPAERAFNDAGQVALGELITTLQSRLPFPVRWVDVETTPGMSDWVQYYRLNRLLGPLLPALPPGRQALLVESWVDSHEASNPQTARSWLQWLASDTGPRGLCYRLKMRLKLVDIPTSRVIWQDEAHANLSNTQLTTLNRSVNRIGSNQAALQSSSMRVASQLVSRVRPWLVDPASTAAVRSHSPIRSLAGPLSRMGVNLP